MDNARTEQLHRRWTLLCRRLNEFSSKPVDTEKWWKILDDHYNEPHRAHHNWDHIYDCFVEFDEVAHLFNLPLLAELALFFHDASYNPGEKDNEKASSKLLKDFCKDTCLGDVTSDLVDCTDHNPARLPTMTNDMKLICAIDLTILGHIPPVYRLYAGGIHYEYKDVPLAVYRAKRAEILEGFLKRDRIFLPDHFHAKYETQARENLTWEIGALRVGEFPEK